MNIVPGNKVATTSLFFSGRSGKQNQPLYFGAQPDVFARQKPVIDEEKLMRDASNIMVDYYDLKQASPEEVMAFIAKMDEVTSRFGSFVSLMPESLQRAALDHFLTVAKVNLNPQYAKYAKNLQTVMQNLVTLHSLMEKFPEAQPIMPIFQELFGRRCMAEMDRDRNAQGLLLISQPSMPYCQLNFPGIEPKATTADRMLGLSLIADRLAPELAALTRDAILNGGNDELLKNLG